MWVFKSKNAPFYAYTYWKKMKRRSTYHSLPHHTVLNSLHFLLFSRRSLFTPIFHRISALRLTSEWVLLTLFFLNLKTALQWQLISLLQMNLFFFFWFTFFLTDAMKLRSYVYYLDLFPFLDDARILSFFAFVSHISVKEAINRSCWVYVLKIASTQFFQWFFL